MSGPRLLILAALVVGLALSNQVRSLNVLAYALVATIVLARLWSWASVRRLTLTRQLRQSRVQAGQPIEERLTLHNEALLPRLWLQVQDHSTLPGHSADRVVDLMPGGSRTWLVHTVCRRRGEYFLGPTTLLSADPIGLFTARRSVPTAQRLVVYPATVDLSGFVLPSADEFGGIRQRPGLHQPTPHAAEVREYHPGDPLNRIHWPTTARITRLMVKEFDRDPTADVWIFLDLEAKPHRGEGDESTEEYGVTIAASLAKLFLDQNRSVGLVASGRRPSILPADRGERQLLKILEELAVARADGDASLAEVLTAEGHRCKRNAALLSITPSLDELWVSGLRQLRLQGTRPVAIVLESSTFGDEQSSLLLVGTLAAADLPTFLVKRGDFLQHALRGDGRRVGAWR